ncbi:MAG: hypothetical protein LBB49_00365, partial [Gracilibacteraceae bacterium]|nr:hypothetical protein [Gracilibacteraceae bacterium]
MSDWMVPLTTGQILDRTFLIFKHHFGRLLLLALLFIGPALLIGILGVILLFAFGLGVDMLAAFDGSYSDSMLFVMLIGYLILFLVLIFSGLGTILLNGSAMFLLDHLRKGLKPKLGTLIRWSFKRFFPMLGAYFCCNAILGVGSNILTLIIYMFVLVIVIAAAAGGTVGVVLSGISMILLSLAAMGAYYYFYLRLDFATAATAMAPVSPGLLQTWRLTRS